MNSTKHLKELIPIIFKVLQNIKEKEKLPFSFYEASITMIAKPHKDIKRNTGQYLLRTLTKYQQTESNNTLKKINSYNQGGFIPGMQG